MSDIQVPPGGIKLNVGCGRKRLDGYVGVDIVARSAADIIAESYAIPLPDDCATEVLAIHLVEHMYSWDVPRALAEWFRLLRPGGQLNLEMPDMLKACRNIADNIKPARRGEFSDQLGMWGVFGDDREKDPYMIHKSGWWFERLRPLVAGVGFVEISEHPTIFHSVGRDIRDFRLEARKPRSV